MIITLEVVYGIINLLMMGIEYTYIVLNEKDDHQLRPQLIWMIRTFGYTR